MPIEDFDAGAEAAPGEPASAALEVSPSAAQAVLDYHGLHFPALDALLRDYHGLAPARIDPTPSGPPSVATDWLTPSVLKSMAQAMDERNKPDPVPSQTAIQFDAPLPEGPGEKFGRSPDVQTQIDPIPGFPQTGAGAFRASNDQVFLDAVNRHNAAIHAWPGDPGYISADLLKAQAMMESGGNRDAFLTDPLSANHAGDWDDNKIAIAGLADRHQVMTPQTSADAALKWAEYKRLDRTKNPGHDLYGMLRDYNGRGDVLPRTGGKPFRDYYASEVLRLANEAAQKNQTQPSQDFTLHFGR